MQDTRTFFFMRLISSIFKFIEIVFHTFGYGTNHKVTNLFIQNGGQFDFCEDIRPPN